MLGLSISFNKLFSGVIEYLRHLESVMSKLNHIWEHSIRVAVFAAIYGLTQVPVLAAQPYRLPFCPAVGERDSEQAQTLEPIKLDAGKQPAGSMGFEKFNANASAAAATIAAPDSKRKSSASTLENAEKANCLPLTLFPSREEVAEKRRLALDSQKSQLSALWTATIERSEDIQFVVKVLQPQTDQKHAVAKGLSLVGGALYNLGSTMSPGARPGLGLIGAPDLTKLFNPSDKGPPISVGETLVLYKMVRDSADALVENYRNYRRVIAERDAAKMDLSDLEDLRQSVLSDDKSLSTLQFDYTIKKAERDVILSEEKTELYRQKLLDQAGPEAVENLDGQIAKERNALARVIGRPDINPPLALPQPESAAAPKDNGAKN